MSLSGICEAAIEPVIYAENSSTEPVFPARSTEVGCLVSYMGRHGSETDSNPDDLGPALITAIETVLVENGVLPDASGCSVNVSLGRSNMLEFFPVDAAPVVVKSLWNTGEGNQNFRSEFDTLANIASKYPGLSPKPLIFEAGEAVTFFAMESIPHQAAGLDGFDRLKDEQMEMFVRFLVGANRKMTPDHATGQAVHRQFTEACAGLPAGLGAEIERISALRHWGRLMEAVAPIPQHGDLAINNVGQHELGIVVFDWEDFGKVLLPAFDFFTLILSGLKFDVGAVQGYLAGKFAPPARTPCWFDKVAEGLRIDEDNVLDFLMISCIIFLYLKKRLGYGTPVAENVQRFLTVIAQRIS